MKESNKRNGLAHVPTCDTWPPTWLISPPTTPITLPAPPVVAERQHFEPLPETSPPGTRVPRGYATDCVFVVADTAGYTGKAMRGPAYMWTWIGAETWHYVSDYPIQK